MAERLSSFLVLLDGLGFSNGLFVLSRGNFDSGSMQARQVRYIGYRLRAASFVGAVKKPHFVLAVGNTRF